MFVLEVITALEKHEVKYALVGGYAMALHGLVRATMDVDLTISLTRKQLEKTEKALESMNLTSRLPINALDIAKFRKEYIEKKNLIAWPFVDFKDPTRMVDILLTDSLTSFRIESMTFRNRKIPVISLKDLLRIKKKSKRPKDQLDVESIRGLLNEK